MYSRLMARIFWALAACSVATAAVSAQARPPARAERLTFSASSGGFTDMGGFSQGDDFFQFDKTVVWGAGLHYAAGGLMVVGVDALIGSPDYTRYQRSQGTELSSGTADVMSILASARLRGSPGTVSFFLTGGVGMFRWDVAELGKNTDLAMTLGIGAELAVAPRVSVFGEYGSWWVYHEKDDSVVKNTARHNLLRGGGRIVVF